MEQTEGFTNDALPVVPLEDDMVSIAETGDACYSTAAAAPAEAAGMDGARVTSSAAATSAESISIGTKRKAATVEVIGWSDAADNGAIVMLLRRPQALLSVKPVAAV